MKLATYCSVAALLLAGSALGLAQDRGSGAAHGARSNAGTPVPYTQSGQKATSGAGQTGPTAYSVHSRPASQKGTANRAKTKKSTKANKAKKKTRTGQTTNSNRAAQPNKR